NDGEFLAYVSRRPPGTMRFTTNPVGNVLCIRSLETGEEKELHPDVHVFGFPRWSPDGKSVVVVSWDVNGNLGYYRIDTQTGNATPVLIDDVFGGHYFSPNGKNFYYGIRDKKTKKYKLVAKNIEDKTEKLIYMNDNRFAFTMSYDGQSFAILSNAEKSMRILPVTGGEPKDLFNSQDIKDLILEDRAKMVTWSRDGAFIYFVARLSGKEEFGRKLYRVLVKDGKITNLGINSKSHFTNLNAHPDGRRFTYSASGESNSEVWVMENFLPLEKLTQNKEKEAAKEPEGIRIKQISKEPYLDDLGTVSSDGRFRSSVDWGDGDLAIHNLINGEKRLLTNNATLETDPQKFVIGSAISKNGKFVAYSWWRPNHTFDLNLVDVDNSSSRLLYKQEGEEVYPVTWLSDNEVITIRQNRKSETTKITSFNVLDDSFHDLKTFDSRRWVQLSTSTDEKYIAYDYTNENNGGKSDISVLMIDGKNEISLVNHPANDKVIGWVPGRKEFLFISDRTGTWDLWAMPFEEGKPSERVKRIYTDIGKVAPIGFTDSGDCFVGFSRRNFNTYIVPFNNVTGTLNKESGKILLGSNFLLDWSPDGQYLAYIKEIDASWQLIIQDLKTDEER
ncbi:MAG: PD40 domain-containing protein, partial [Cyclobacteriaceae bacterium]|nr:PD40 domain-containing protein [Cyclobacteriaceae bacterium]